MSEHKPDLSKLTDYEFSMLIIERNICNYKAEQIDELLNKIGEAKGLSTAEKSAAPLNQQSQLPGSFELNKLPWKSYKTKENAGPEEAAWIFAKTSGAEALVATLKTENGQAKIGSYEYQLQGKEHQFIARTPVK